MFTDDAPATPGFIGRDALEHRGGLLGLFLHCVGKSLVGPGAGVLFFIAFFAWATMAPEALAQTPKVSLVPSRDLRHIKITEGESFTFTVKADRAPKKDLTVNLKIDERSDFVASSQEGWQTVVIPAGQKSAAYTINMIDDNVDEHAGTIQVTLSSGNGYRASPADWSALLKVRDNDVYTGGRIVDISEGNTVSEGDSVPFTITTNLAPPEDLTVNLYVYGLWGVLDQSEEGRKTVVIPAGQKSATYTVNVHDDNVDQGNQQQRRRYVQVNVVSGEDYLPKYRGLDCSRLVYVLDNDPLPITIAAPDTSIARAGGTTEVTVSLKTERRTSVTVALNVVGATAGKHYELRLKNSNNVTLITNGTYSPQNPGIRFNRHANYNPETQEAVLVLRTLPNSDPVERTLIFTHDADRGINLDTDLSESGFPLAIAIANNDSQENELAPEMSLATGSAVDEGGNAQFTITASSAPEADLTVAMTIAQTGNYLATPGAGRRTVTLAAGATTATLAVATVDDDTDERDGSVSVVLNASTGYTVAAGQAIGTVSVSDNDTVVSITGGSAITEGGTASFTLTAKPAPQSPLAVEVTVADSGTFASSGQLGTKTVTIDTTGTATLDVTTDNDGTDEPYGSLTATVQAGTGYIPSGTHGSASITVKDDDRGPYTVRLFPNGDLRDTTTVTEGESFTFTVTADAAPKKDLTVNLRIVELGDFIASSQEGRQTVVIPAGQKSATYTINMIDDNVDEGANYIQVTISSGNGYRVHSGVAIVKVTDNDVYTGGRTISISGGDPVSEGDSIPFTITTNLAPTEDLTVNLGVYGLWGVLDQSEEGRKTVVIPASQKSATYTVNLHDDNVDQSNQQQRYVVPNIYPGEDYLPAKESWAYLVYVLDNDPLPITIAASDTSIARADGTTEVTVSLKTERRTSVTVALNVVGATAGKHYELRLKNSNNVTLITNGTYSPQNPGIRFNRHANHHPETQEAVLVLRTLLNFDPVERTLVFTHDADRGINLDTDLSESGFPLAIAIANNNSQDNELVPEMSLATGSVVDEGGNAQFTITASSAPEADLTVAMTVAQTGDYLDVPGAGRRTVTLAAGATTATLAVATLDDDTNERDGSVSVILNAGTGYTVASGQASGGTVAVSDDDDPPPPVVSITGGSAITEGDTASFTLTATPAPESALTVEVTVADSGAFAASGQLSTKTITIDTTGTATLDVTTDNDGTDEPDGTLTATVQTGTGYAPSGTHASAAIAVHDNDVATACVSDQLLAKVEGYYEHNRNRPPGYGENWFRVLVAFGVQTGDAWTATSRPIVPMTAADAREREANWFGWGPMADALECLEGMTSSTDPEITITGSSSITEGGDAVFTVSASVATTTNLTVSLTVTDDGTSDFLAQAEEGNRTVTISAGQTSATLTMSTEDDSTDEGDGSVTATVGSATGYQIGSPSSATVAVSDDDDPPVVTPVVSVSGGSAITEGGTASFTLTATPAPQAALTVEVTVEDSGAFAASGESGAQQVTLGTTGTATFDVVTENDSTDETDGALTATIQVGTGYAPSGTHGSAAIAVHDNDVATACVSDQLLATVEGYYEHNQNRPPGYGENWFRVLVAFGVQTADAWTATSRTIVPMAAADAREREANWSGWGPMAEALECLEGVSSTDPEITVTGGSGITEGGDAVFTVTASAAPTANLTVSLTVTDDGTSDFLAQTEEGTRTVTISAGQTSATLTVSTEEDSTDEGDGGVTATVGSATGYQIGSPSSAMVAVNDDDDPPVVTPVVSVSGGSAITEGGTASFTLTATPAPQAALTVEVTVEDSGAFAASGESGAQQVTLGTTGTATFDVVTENDSTDEPDGALTATVQTGTGYTVAASPAAAASVAVSDNDDPPPPVVSITGGSAISEGGTASFTLTAMPAPQAALTVEVTVEDSGAFAASGESGVQQVTLGTTGTATFDVVTENDSTDEPDGALTATVQTGTGYTVAASPAAAASVAVSDDDNPPPPVVSITGGSAISEGGTASFTLTATPAPQAALTVEVTVEDSGAFAASGESGVQQVTLGTTGTARFDVVTENDSTDEPDGALTATVQTGTGYTVAASPAAAASVAVSDDDDPPPPVVSVSGGSAISEGGTASFTLTATPAPQTALTVEVTVEDSGAFAASGESGGQQVTLGTTGTATFDVVTEDDSADEPDGALTATVQTGTGYAPSGTHASAAIAVHDNDMVTACVSDQLLATVEGYYEHNQNRPPGYGENWFRVLVAFGVQTADAWTATSHTMTPMTAADAREQEAKWSGWGPMAEALECLEGASPTDPEITVTGGSAITEGGDAVFTVSASPAPAANLTVSLTVTDAGTSDFLAQSEEGTRTVTISAGQTSATLTVATEEDSTDEGDGSVTATVGSATGYQIGSPSTATVMVSDDDDPPVTTPVVSVSGGSAITEGGTASFTLTATPAPQSALTVEVTVADSSAFAASGESGAQQVTLGTTGTATFDVVTDDDNTDEPDGTLTATVQSGTGYTVAASPADVASVAVADDDDPLPLVVSITGGSAISEGGTASFTLTATPAPQAALTVEVTVEDSGAFAASGESGVQQVTLGTTGTARFDVVTENDSTDEPDGALTATVQTGTGYTVAASPAAAASVAVSDNDDPPPPVVSITGGSTISEGGTASFTLTAMPAPQSTLTVEVTVEDSGAFAASGESGAQQVTLGTTGTATFDVVTEDDSTDEPDGALTATVQVGTGYAPSDTHASAAIAVHDNDVATACVSDQLLATVEGYYEHNQNRPPGYGENWFRVLVAFGVQTADAWTATSHTMTPMTATDAREREAKWSGWGPMAEALECLEGASPTDPEITVTGGSGVIEGDDAVFTVSASPAPAANLTVSLTVTDDGTSDFLAQTEEGTRTITILAGQTSATLTVSTEEDSTDEGDGSVTATVGSATGYQIGSPSTATVMVSDDDDPPVATPVVSVSGGSAITEGGTASFTLTATPVPQSALSVEVTVADSGAFAASGESGAQQVTLGTTGTATFDVVTDDDNTDEPDGTLTATVQAGTGYTVATSPADVASLAVADNDGATAGAPSFSISDATANENSDWRIFFTIRLNRPVEHTMAVTFSTRESNPVSAREGQDYQGLWRDGIQIPFFRGQTEKQIWVPIFNDHHDEDPETFEAVLSNATNGAVIGDGVGIGTITNSDLMPAAWLGRFGRTVSQQVVAALQGRFAANPQTGLNLTVAGEALTSTPPLAENQQVLAKVLGFETVTAHQLVEGSSFSFSPEGEAGSAARFAIWGQGALSSFSGQQNSVALDGDVTTALVGAEWSGARWRAGAALSHSWGSGSYTEDNTDTTEDNTGNNAVANGDITTTLTGIFPYGRYGLTPRLAIWAVAGYGWGSLSLKPDGAGTDYSPGTTLTMGAVGMDGLLRDGGAEGLSLTSTADALLVKTTSEAVAGLASSEANISRLRLGLEATRPVPLANGAALLPSLELGIRHDDGDAETGFGMELAAGLTWTDPGRGISAQLQGRTLLTHADEAFREQGLAISFAWEPNPTNRGPSLALSHAMGATAAAGMDALLNPTTMEALTAATDSSRDSSGQHQFEATLAYGFPAFNGRLTFTPGLGLTLSPDSRTYSLLWALAPYAQQPQADELWQISLEGERQENSNPTSSADHSLALRFSLLF